MYRLLLFCFLLLTLSNAAAQDTPYHLVTPTANDYYNALIKYGHLISEPESPDYFQIEAISKVLFALYPEPLSVDLDTQYDTYSVLQIGEADFQPRDVWLKRMVAAWLYENDIDLSTIADAKVKDINIRVIPRDFDGDNQDEYLLDVMKGEVINRNQCLDDTEVAAYYLVDPTRDGYQFIDTGLPWKGSYMLNPQFATSVGGLVEVFFGDINADSLPEWVLLNGGEPTGNGSQGFYNYGKLYVLGWRDSSLKHFAEIAYITDMTRCYYGPYSPTISWKFITGDEDNQPRILLHEKEWDNWDCIWIRTESYEWNLAAEEYVQRSVEKTYAEDSTGCQQRYAEEAMWSGNYPEAVRHYVQALELMPVPPELDHYADGGLFTYGYDRYQYLRIRAALAYLLTGQINQAKALLQILQLETFYAYELQIYAEMLLQLANNQTTPLQVCMASFRLMIEHPPEHGWETLRWDLIDEERIGPFLTDVYHPENISCDAPEMVRETVRHLSIPVDQSPRDGLKALGIHVTDEMRLDLNRDGQSEWLMWLDVPGVELFFAPNGDTFTIDTSPQVDPFQQADKILIKTLPGNSQEALVIVGKYRDGNGLPPWAYTYGDYGAFFGPQCSEAYGNTVGEIHVLGLINTQLSNLLEMPNCDPTLADSTILPEILVSRYFLQDASQTIDTYQWNQAEGRYVLALQPESRIQPTELPNGPETEQRDYRTTEDAFSAGAYQVVLNQTPDRFELVDTHPSVFELKDYYLRALSLQALGRDDEALAVFVTLHDAASDHIWGILAGLHVETAS